MQFVDGQPLFEKKKGEKPRQSIFPFIWASFSRRRVEKKRVLAEICLFVFYWPHHAAWITIPTRDQTPTPAWSTQSLNHWTTREVLARSFCCCVLCAVPTASHLWREKRNKPRNVLPNGFLFPVLMALINTPAAVYPSGSGVASCILNTV